MNRINRLSMIAIIGISFLAKANIDYKISQAVKDSNPHFLQSLLNEQALTLTEHKDLLEIAQSIKDHRITKLKDRVGAFKKNAKLIGSGVISVIAAVGGFYAKLSLKALSRFPMPESAGDQTYSQRHQINQYIDRGFAKKVSPVCYTVAGITAAYCLQLLLKKWASESRYKRYLNAVEVEQILKRKISV